MQMVAYKATRTPCCMDTLMPNVCKSLYNRDHEKFTKQCRTNADFSFIQCCHSCHFNMDMFTSDSKQSLKISEITEQFQQSQSLQTSINTMSMSFSSVTTHSTASTATEPNSARRSSLKLECGEEELWPASTLRSRSESAERLVDTAQRKFYCIDFKIQWMEFECEQDSYSKIRLSNRQEPEILRTTSMRRQHDFKESSELIKLLFSTYWSELCVMTLKVLLKYYFSKFSCFSPQKIRMKIKIYILSYWLRHAAHTLKNK